MFFSFCTFLDTFVLVFASLTRVWPAYWMFIHENTEFKKTHNSHSHKHCHRRKHMDGYVFWHAQTHTFKHTHTITCSIDTWKCQKYSRTIHVWWMLSQKCSMIHTKCSTQNNIFWEQNHNDSTFWMNYVLFSLCLWAVHNVRTFT